MRSLLRSSLAWRLALPLLCALGVPAEPPLQDAAVEPVTAVEAARDDEPRAGERLVVEARRVPLDPSRWSPVGEAARIFDEPSEGMQVFAGMGARWSTVFEIDRAGTARVLLDWSPGPDGQLLELLLDGQRLGPPRDGWRPTERRVVADLGSRWLGPGRHLLEIVAREERFGRVRLHELVLRAPELGTQGASADDGR